MGRWIDETELEKYIMHDGCEKGCGYIDERDLKYIQTVETIQKDDVIAILDKIRAEIDNALSDGMIHKKTVLGIIDKYKADTEVEDG